MLKAHSFPGGWYDTVLMLKKRVEATAKTIEKPHIKLLANQRHSVARCLLL
jgi:hypothetical protein